MLRAISGTRSDDSLMTTDHLLGQHLAGAAAQAAGFDGQALACLLAQLQRVRTDGQACVQLVGQMALTLQALALER